MCFGDATREGHVHVLWCFHQMDTCAYALVTPPESDMCFGDSTRRKASAWKRGREMHVLW